MKMNRRAWLLSSGLATFSAKASLFQTSCSLLDSEIHLAEGLIRMNLNENPYGPSEATKKAMMEAMHLANRYSETTELKNAIAKHHGVLPEQVLIGTGSSHILMSLALGYFNQPEDEIISPSPTFHILPNAVATLGSKKTDVPLTGDKHVDLNALKAAISPATKMVYICNPNNPTGTKLEHNALLKFVREASQKTMIAVDEVYHDFIEDPSLIPYTKDNKNIVIIRSMSKVYGLAGMRIGYAIAHPDTIRHLAKFSLVTSLSISQPVIAGAIAALKDQDFVNMYLAKTAACKEILYKYLKENNIEFYPSYANIVYFSLDRFPNDYLSKVQEGGILVREVMDYGRRFCRVSTSKPEEMVQFVNIIAKLLV